MKFQKAARRAEKRWASRAPPVPSSTSSAPRPRCSSTPPVGPRARINVNLAIVVKKAPKVAASERRKEMTQNRRENKNIKA